MQDRDNAGPELVSMLADYMERGFLDNIIDMFKHDRTLYPLAATLIQDERVRVRVGTTALIEEMKKVDPENVRGALPALIPLLRHDSAVVRGDAANLVGIIGDPRSLMPLRELLHDSNEQVRVVAAEAIADIEREKS